MDTFHIICGRTDGMDRKFVFVVVHTHYTVCFSILYSILTGIGELLESGLTQSSLVKMI